jgi:spore coat protein U-like protein
MAFGCSFLKMVASGPDAFVVNYSDRFTLTGMTGTFSPDLENGISSLNGGHKQQELRKRQAAGAYTIPYQLQTGPTRYAPMAKKPGSTIPVNKSPTPQFPTSAYDVATAYLAAPTVQTTVSATLTYSVSSIENTVCITRLGSPY